MVSGGKSGRRDAIIALRLAGARHPNAVARGSGVGRRGPSMARPAPYRRGRAPERGTRTRSWLRCAFSRSHLRPSGTGERRLAKRARSRRRLRTRSSILLPADDSRADTLWTEEEGRGGHGSLGG